MGFKRITTGLSGTSNQGKMTVSYHSLVEVFGHPNGGPEDGKVQVQWGLKFDGDIVATIYDWKKNGQPVEQITSWNIGGKSMQAMREVYLALGLDVKDIR